LKEKNVQELSDLKYDSNGLIPAIIQDAETKEVLMMAYMNEQSLRATIETGKTHFWSRSRQKYWMKGESSGHVQEVREIRIDCDKDTLLISVNQIGAACHEGYHNCFYRKYTSGSWTVDAQRIVDPEQVYKK
jgi:phosphoribosyl-AMP cyclohydrolase